MRWSSDRVLNNKDTNRSNWILNNDATIYSTEFWTMIVEFQWGTSMDVGWFDGNLEEDDKDLNGSNRTMR